MLLAYINTFFHRATEAADFLSNPQDSFVAGQVPIQCQFAGVVGWLELFISEVTRELLENWTSLFCRKQNTTENIHYRLQASRLDIVRCTKEIHEHDR